MVLTWRMFACPKPGGARGSAFDSKSKGWWFDSTPSFRSGSLVGTIPSSSFAAWSSFLSSPSCTRLRRESSVWARRDIESLFFQKAPGQTGKTPPFFYPVDPWGPLNEGVTRGLFVTLPWRSLVFSSLRICFVLPNYVPFLYHKAKPSPSSSYINLLQPLSTVGK